ncbi:glycine--tRNA ligase subunit beta [Candidatus Providencia siddallii]|uniref:Glycine--tRNA ligase beta subunit n=1 Tax=Candidatus Providencia siddallii TaxID=1715285 RepID=A0ABM9NPK8_9GAMM
MIKKTFLIEIGTEELPPKELKILAESFKNNFLIELKKVNIIHGDVKWFATSRRLALKILNLSLLRFYHKIEKRGPAVFQAFDSNGIPTKIGKAWAYSCNISINQAERIVTEKGEWLVYRYIEKSKNIKELLVNVVKKSICNLNIVKSMRWSNKDIQFIRPIRTITMILGKDLIKGKILGVNSKRNIFGHRFMGKTKLIINDANEYPDILRKYGKVIADYEERKRIIIYEIKRIAKKLGGKVYLKNDDLIDEITSIIEWPVILIGNFKKKFLEIPLEELIYNLKKNQRCFFIYDKNNYLIPNFIFVSNIESSNSKEIIIGNEKVMNSRLSDIEFFLKMDKKIHLKDNLYNLKSVLFYNKLGTLFDKTFRLKLLSIYIAKKINANIDHVSRAAILSKCDLLTNMVFEYTNMQGIIGMYYALRDGEHKDVALALKEQYKPSFFDDKLPSTKVSDSLSIAEKIDNLVGILGIKKNFKGDNDPFALRRAAIGVLRIIIKNCYSIDLLKIVQKSVYLYGDKLSNVNVVNDVINFMFARLLFWYKYIGYKINIIQSVLACNLTQPYDFDLRIKAVDYFCSLKDSQQLIITNKRISNILNKSKESLSDKILISIMNSPEEVRFAINIILLQIKLSLVFINKNYKESLIELLSFYKNINIFFEKVKILDENKEIRINRLTLLNYLQELFLKIADISLLK